MTNWKKIESDMWLPEKKGDSVEGEIVNMNPDGTYGLAVDLKKADGKIINLPSHKVLQNRLRNLKVGNKVKVEFTGEEPPSRKGDSPTKMYDVYVAD